MNDTLIKVENVSKKYCKSLKRSMFYGISDITRNIFGFSSYSDKLRKNEFWAVNDVSFELKRGETIGVIGANGSGKTTLLKMLNGIFWPDKGKISIKGRVGALIEVGAGFHPMLTGRENIYLNGSILGMSKEEINKKFHNIVDFADINDFLDTPVKNYSSGMFVRLGFSIAVHSEPDILLVDEILAVGDAEFRAKCYNKVAKLKEKTAIIFVSHNMTILRRLVDNCIVLKKGDVCFSGKTTNSIQFYYNMFSNLERNYEKIGNDFIKVTKFILNGVENPVKINVRFEDEIKIKIVIKSKISIKNFLNTIVFRNVEDTIVAECNSKMTSNFFQISENGIAELEIIIPKVTLNPGIYSIAILFMSKDMLTHYYWDSNALKLEIEGKDSGNAPVHFLSDYCYIEKSNVQNKLKNQEDEKNVFFVGHARGGTTMLAGIINWHSKINPKYYKKKNYKNNINCFLEELLSKKNHIIYSERLEQKDLWFSKFPGEDIFTHMGKELIVEDFDWTENEISEFRDKIRQDFDKGSNSYFLSKAPSNSFRVKVIPKIFQNPKIIALYRNGPEVIASWGLRGQGFGKSVNWGNTKYRKLSYKKGIDIFSQKWFETLEYLENARKDMGFLAIKYDDLIDNTSETLELIFRYLELPIEDYIYEVDLVDARNKWKKNIPEKYYKYILEKTEEGQKILNSLNTVT